MTEENQTFDGAREELGSGGIPEE